MRRILDRYIFKEIATTWLGVTLVLLLILLTNQFAQILREVAKGKLPKDAAFDVIALSALEFLTVLIPIALFLSVMMGLGRLYRDSEMPAMMACRTGPAGIYRPLLWLFIPLTMIVAWLSVDVGPRALIEIDRIASAAQREADLASIEPGRFTTFGPDDAVVYGERVTAEGSMENVFMQRSTEAGVVEVVVAQRGEQAESDDPDVRMLVLHNGRRYEGIPGTTQFRVVEFVEHGIPYQLPNFDEPDVRPKSQEFHRLIGSSDPEEIAELQWRISVPLSTLLLGFIAVPLSRARPREGRYGRLAIGLLVFIIYLNLMSAAKAWIEQGVISPDLGIWWVHGLIFLFGLALLAIQNNWIKRILS